VPHEVLAREIKQALVVALGADPPLLEGGGVVDMRRYPFLVERVDQLFVDQDIGPASLVLEALDLGDQVAVMR